MDGETSEIVTPNLALARVESGPDIDPKGFDRPGDGTGTANCSSGTIKAGKKPIPGCLDLSAAEPI